MAESARISADSIGSADKAGVGADSVDSADTGGSADNVGSVSWDEFVSAHPRGGRVDKIIGMIYGQALGDAVGLMTEFKFKRDRPKMVFPYRSSIRNFPVCDWTDDTDHLIIVMQSLIDNSFALVPQDIAVRLREWVRHGFAELGDTCGMGLGGTMNMVITHKKFADDPFAAANEVWHNSGKKLAANGSLMRTSIIGSLPDPAMCERYACKLGLVTHSDPRCVASCVLQSLVVGNLINGKIDSADAVDRMITDSVGVARKYIAMEAAPTESEMRHQPTPKAYLDPAFKSRDEELSYWVETAYTKGIGELRLDDMVKIGYVFKCLACSVYALQVIKAALKNRRVPSFKKFVLKVVAECGDADTNAAVAGATMGAYLGYSRMPSDWVAALPNRDWLNAIIMRFLSAMGVKEWSTLLRAPTDPSGHLPGSAEGPPAESRQSSADVRQEPPDLPNCWDGVDPCEP